jgi:hypothetical protein
VTTEFRLSVGKSARAFVLFNAFFAWCVLPGFAVFSILLFFVPNWPVVVSLGIGFAGSVASFLYVGPAALRRVDEACVELELDRLVVHGASPWPLSVPLTQVASVTAWQQVKAREFLLPFAGHFAAVPVVSQTASRLNVSKPVWRNLSSYKWVVFEPQDRGGFLAGLHEAAPHIEIDPVLLEPA